MVITTFISSRYFFVFLVCHYMFCSCKFSFARVTLGSYFRKKALHCVVTFRPGMPTRLFSGLLDNSRIRQLADCQLADATGDSACLVFVLLAVSARPRVVQSASWQSASWRIRELSIYRFPDLGSITAATAEPRYHRNATVRRRSKARPRRRRSAGGRDARAPIEANDPGHSESLRVVESDARRARDFSTATVGTSLSVRGIRGCGAVKTPPPRNCRVARPIGFR